MIIVMFFSFEIGILLYNVTERYLNMLITIQDSAEQAYSLLRLFILIQREFVQFLSQKSISK